MSKASTQLTAAIAFSLLSASLLLAQTSLTKETAGEKTIVEIVDRAAQDFFKNSPHAVGLSIGIFKDGKKYTYNYGTVERGRDVAPTARTMYSIGSITKTFTGTLLAQAAVEKKVKLDDDIRKYLDGDYPNLEFAGHPIRLYQLVNHRSGLPFQLPNRPEMIPGYNKDLLAWSVQVDQILKDYTKEDFLKDLHEVKLSAIPGEKFQYSNSGAQLAAYILERVYGKPYEELLKAKILRPLGMDDTTFPLSESQATRAIASHDEQGRPVQYPPQRLVGATALHSTASDMLKYVQAQVTENDAAVKLSHMPTFTDHNYSAGLNWQVLQSENRRIIWQEGNIPGFTSYCINEPEVNCGIVILTNQEDMSSSHQLSVMANEILKAISPKAVLLPS